MAEFNIRSESVDVEQIMQQIRARIREKRGVDYTEEQIRELASVRLEKFLDPKNLRSDLLEQFRRSRPAIPPDPPPIDPPYVFTDQTLFASHRGALRFLRRLLKPVLMLFFNANSLNQILHVQAQFNADLLKREQRRRIEFEQSRAEWNALYYEVLHNLVLETTRNGIELKNLKMRLEALASRLDFSERRVRALEGVVQYRPEVLRPRDRDRERERDRRERNAGAPESGEAADGAMPPAESGAVAGQSAGEPGARRRRRRRRGRRSGGIGPVPAAAAADEGGAGASDEYDEAADMDAGSDAAEAADESATSAESAHVSPEKTGDAATGRPNGEPDQQ